MRRNDGFVLVVVAGLAAMLLAMAMVFLQRVRSDVAESSGIEVEIQCRVMLHAAMMYLQETNRIGWGDESYGWNDVRPAMWKPAGAVGTWSIGPRRRDGTPMYDTAWTPGGSDAAREAKWPAPGGIARCPMDQWAVPPLAVSGGLRPNAVLQPSTYDPRNLDDSTLPVMIDDYIAPGYSNNGGRNPDWCVWDTGNGGIYTNLLRPAFYQKDPRPVFAAAADFRGGDPRPFAAGTGRAWFRVYRETAADHPDLPDDAAIFIVTCGSGGTRGYRTAADASSGGMSASLWEMLDRSERRLWYRVAIDSGVSVNAMAGPARHFGGKERASYWNRRFLYHDAIKANAEDLIFRDVADADLTSGANAQGHWGVSAPLPSTLFGTVRFIERLESPPAVW